MSATGDTKGCGGCTTCAELAGVERPPDDREFTAPGLFVKQMYVAKAGTLIPQHAHASPHLTMVAAGGFRLWKDGERVGDYHAPAGIFIEAGVKHTFLALADQSIAYCIHNTMSTGGVDIMSEHHFDGVPAYAQEG